jgi:glutathione S-transferase
MMIDALLTPGVGEAGRRSGEVLGARYGYSKEAAAAAPARAAAVLTLLSKQLERQKQAGHDFLVGNALSAADLHWSTFAALVRPMDAELCPMPDYLRGWYANAGPVLDAALDPALLAHRDRIYRNYLPLPMSF